MTWFIQRVSEEGDYYVPIRPTGRWKLKFSPGHGQPTLYVQHRTWCLFTMWIPEHDLYEFRGEYVSRCAA